jgi:hypothetical protein
MTCRANGFGVARDCHRLVPNGVRGDAFNFDHSSSDLLGHQVLKEAASNSNGFYRKVTVVLYA